MTGIRAGSPVKRETATLYRGRPIMVELHPGYMKLRQKGKRHTVDVDYTAILELGYKILHRAEMEERKKLKAGRGQHGAVHRRRL